jgi:hypothetical protein
MKRIQAKEATKINQTQQHSSINISQMNFLEALAKVATKASRVQTIHTAATLAKGTPATIS